MTVTVAATRPAELQLEGAIIQITRYSKVNGEPYYSRGRVIEVSGPHPPDPDWYARPHMGGYTIEFECLDEHRMWQRKRYRTGWLNEVHVDDGRIYAYPWRDEVEVVEWPDEQQTTLF